MTSELPADANAMVGADELIVRAKTDRAAFGQLFDRYYPRVAHYCGRGAAASGEEITSEVFLQVAARIGTFAGQTDTDFCRWLFRIATNAIAAHHRKTARRLDLLRAGVESGRLGTAANAPADGDGRLDWPTVQAALEQLSEREQTIVALRFFADCSHEEIAAAVDANPGAVRTALARALAKLRDQLRVHWSAD